MLNCTADKVRLRTKSDNFKQSSLIKVGVYWDIEVFEGKTLTEMTIS